MQRVRAGTGLESLLRNDGPRGADIVSDEPPELPFGSIHPSERASIISAAPGGSRLDLVPWGWPPRDGKGLVINVRSETRRNPPPARGIAPMDRFYEYWGAKPPKSKFEFAPAVNAPRSGRNTAQSSGSLGQPSEGGRITATSAHKIRAIAQKRPLTPRKRPGFQLANRPWPRSRARANPCNLRSKSISAFYAIKRHEDVFSWKTPLTLGTSQTQVGQPDFAGGLS